MQLSLPLYTYPEDKSISENLDKASEIIHELSHQLNTATGERKIQIANMILNDSDIQSLASNLVMDVERWIVKQDKTDS